MMLGLGLSVCMPRRIVPPEGDDEFTRITEDGETRITEDGETRILESE